MPPRRRRFRSARAAARARARSRRAGPSPRDAGASRPLATRLPREGSPRPASRRSREQDPKPHAAGAEHRVDLLQRAGAVAPPRPRAGRLGSRKELVEGRIEQADRHRQPLHRLEQPLEVALLQRRQLGVEAPRRGPRRSRRGSPRRSPRGGSSPKNMCSVRQRPIPSAPNSSALRASSGVSALVRTPRRRSSSAQRRTVWNSSLISGSTNGTSALVALPRRRRSPAGLRRAASARRRPAPPGRRVDLERRRHRSPRARPSRARRARRATALPPSEVTIPLAA